MVPSWRGLDVLVSDATQVQDFWDGFYQERGQIWSGKVNAVMAGILEGWMPGTALDLGCGEGGDAVWLAEQGWTVTAVDVAPTALERAAAHAAELGVADRITFEQVDLGHAFPQGSFDLVSAQFLHSPVHLERGEILRRAAQAVAPGGALLVVGHAAPPPWAHRQQHNHDNHDHGNHDHSDHDGQDDPHLSLPGAEQVVEDLRLDPAHWTIERADTVEREATGPDGQVGMLTDSVVLARRSG